LCRESRNGHLRIIFPSLPRTRLDVTNRTLSSGDMCITHSSRTFCEKQPHTLSKCYFQVLLMTLPARPLCLADDMAFSLARMDPYLHSPSRRRNPKDAHVLGRRSNGRLRRIQTPTDSVSNLKLFTVCITHVRHQAPKNCRRKSDIRN
jgi:hypothetical protein